MITHINVCCAISIATMFSCLGSKAEAFVIPTNLKSITSHAFKETLPKSSDQIDYYNKFFNEHVRLKRQLNIIQSKINDFVHPKPIVDTIREEEKYGNMVEHTFGKSIVKVVENLSQVINAVFSFPVDTVKKVSRTATEALNNIGGKLVGLQR